MKAFGPFLDTLMPQDAFSPSATALGVDRAIIARFPTNHRLQQLVFLGCNWLDNEARKEGGADFTSVSPILQESIVGRAEDSPAQSLPLVFFTTLRGLTWLHYYTRAESWPGLGYTGPPQPGGFMGHDKPPAGIAG